MEHIKLFNQSDWMNYEGSEGWKERVEVYENRDPLITRNECGTVVADSQGILAMPKGDPQNEHGGYVMDIKFPTQFAARCFLKGFPKNFDREKLLEEGFVEA